MKKCILIHINDGNAEVLQNGNFLLVERFVKAEQVIEEYLSQGYEVKQMIPDYSPVKQADGSYAFNKGSVTIYFEKSDPDDQQANAYGSTRIADFPANVPYSSDEEPDLEGVSLEQVIEWYLDPSSKVSETELQEYLESMEYSRETVDQLLETVRSYDIWEVYNALLTQYRDFLTDDEYAELIDAYNETFDAPLPEDV